MEIIEMKVSPSRWTDNLDHLDCPVCGVRLDDDPRWTKKESMKDFIAHCPRCNGYVYDGRIISEKTAYSMIGEAAV